MNYFLVGGAVRDILMGLEPKDRDWVVVDSDAETLLSMGYEQVGMGFPVFLHPETREEFALARREKKVGAGYTGFEFDTDEVTLMDDLSRRDLTINSMAFGIFDEMNDRTVIDYFGGMDDLRSKTLRHTTEAFRDDPLRVVRLARFFARYKEFTVASETMKLAAEMVDAGVLNELPDERFWLELSKAFSDGGTDRFFALLFELGALHKVRFFQRLIGAQPVNIEKVMKLAREFTAPLSGDRPEPFHPKQQAHMFAAALTRDPIGLFADLEASHVFNALESIRALPESPTGLDTHDVISKMRGFSTENHTLENTWKVLHNLERVGEYLPLTAFNLKRAAYAARRVTAQQFLDQGLQGRELGAAIATARVNVIIDRLHL
jgi:tRNA nucleotidyltransferase/poly(A) polymerase